MSLPVVIVGAGLAGVRTAQALRDAGCGDPIVLIGEEPHVPYDRPSLSKELLSGLAGTPPSLASEGWFAEAGVETMWSEAVVAIDPAPLAVRLASGVTIAASGVVLATGSVDRRLSVRGATLDGVLTLRSLDHGLHLRTRLAAHDRIVVVGGGLIGCEVASTARALGKAVTVVEATSLPLARVFGLTLGFIARGWLEEIGVQLLFEAKVAGFAGETSVTAVELADGRTLPADLVLVSVGAAPRTELAVALGLDVPCGVEVDACGRTAIDGVFAVGDVARWPLRDGGARCLETYLNSQEQAAAVATAIMGAGVPAPQRPQFWTVIAGRKVQASGDLAGAGEVVLRGDPSDAGFLMFRVDPAGTVAAVAAIDSPKDYGVARRLLDANAVVDLALLMDAAVPLRTLLKQREAA